MIARAITFLIFLILLICMMSCGQRFHLRKYEKLKAKAERHLGIAIAKGASVKTDTLYTGLKIPIPGINISFPFKPIKQDVDTVYYARDGVDVKIVYKRDNEGKAIAAKPIVRTDTIYKTIRVPYTIRTEIKCDPPRRFKWAAIGFFIGATLSLAAIILLKR